MRNSLIILLALGVGCSSNVADISDTNISDIADTSINDTEDTFNSDTEFPVDTGNVEDTEDTSDTHDTFDTSDTDVEDTSVELPVECSEASYDSSNYLFCNLEYTYDNALAICQEQGYELVIFEIVRENDWVASQFSNFDMKNSAYIALNDINREGRWMWSFFRGIGFKNWSDNQPDGARQQNCVVISTSDGTWFDVDCNQENAFVCEKKD